MKTQLLACAVAAILLGACSDSVTMKAASVTRYNDGTELLMTGELVGKLDGSSITRLSGNGLTCEMSMTRQSDRSMAGIMNCTDKTGSTVYSERQEIPADEVKIGFNGHNVSETNTPLGRGIVAFGWGKKASIKFLRGALSK